MKHIKTTILAIALLFYMGIMVKGQNTNDCSSYKWSYRIFISSLMTNLTSNQFSNEEKTGMGYNMGGDLVYAFYQKSKYQLNVSLGFGLTHDNSKRNTDYKNELWTSEYEEVLGNLQSFYLTETAQNLDEHQQMTFLDIPVKLGIIYVFTPKWSGYCNVGLSYGININAKYSGTANLTRTGFYPDYNVLLYDVDVTGSPYYYPTNKAVSGSGTIQKTNNFSGEFALGINFKASQKMTFFAGTKMMHGFVNVKKNTETFILAKNATSLNTLANRTDKVQTRAAGLEIGFRFNLGNCSETNK